MTKPPFASNAPLRRVDPRDPAAVEVLLRDIAIIRDGERGFSLRAIAARQQTTFYRAQRLMARGLE